MQATPAPADRFAPARAVADAVLFEGYVLYPYRASARKNQVRWQFGVLAPRAYCEREGTERWAARTECLVDPVADPTVTVRIRCLQVQRRAVEAAAEGTDEGTDAGFRPCDGLTVDGTRHLPWDEAVEQVVDLPAAPLRPGDADHHHVFAFPAGEEVEALRHADGTVAGRLVRRREAVQGRVRVHAERPDHAHPLVKVVVTVENPGDWAPPGARRDDALLRSAVAVHTMLAVDGGAFVSLLDPPADAAAAAAACDNDGTFPVLVGPDLVLSSPIILYDHPEVAAESPGDLYDATEIDEILALRVLTLTDEEKAEARATDPRAAAVVDRCDDMPPEMWERLHGAMRSLTPADAVPVFTTPGEAGPGPAPPPWWDPATDAEVDPWRDTLTVGGVALRQGSAVRLRPSHRADAQDLFLTGLAATVAGVFRDVDGNDHVAVTVDSDPATEALAWQGRYLFFHPDEVEPLADGEAAP